jgi:site-specific DNA recombinase
MEKRAVIYIRVSDQSQIDNNSLGTQEKTCKQAAQSQDYEIVKIFRDEGKSAKNMQRPAMRELLSYCCDKSNKVSAIFVYQN